MSLVAYTDKYVVWQEESLIGSISSATSEIYRSGREYQKGDQARGLASVDRSIKTLLADADIRLNRDHKEKAWGTGKTTVTDKGTGLTWQREDDGKKRTWNQSELYCAKLKLAGHEDWRLPALEELTSIVDASKTDPAIDTSMFPNTRSEYYWTSITYVGDSTQAWFVLFETGSLYYYPKSTKSSFGPYARCVRGG